MPIYAYRCENCGVQFERRQSFSDDPLVTCPECEEPSLRKLIQPVGIVFKGSGFYVTDNRSDEGARATNPASASNGDNEKSDAKSSTAKTESDSSSTEKSKDD